HAGAQSILKLFALAAEEEDDVVDHLAIRVFRREADNTRPEALMHVVIQTRPRQRALAVDDLEIATAQLELIGNELQQSPRGAGEEWPVKEIAFLAIEATREDDAREILRQRDLQIWIRLVVAKEDVVTRLMRLDEIVLEEDRLELVVR